MEKTIKVPVEYATISASLVAHAFREGSGPQDSKKLKEFQEWLLYESDALNYQDLGGIVWLPGLEFTDEEVLDDMGLPEGAMITDAQRLAYGRKRIENFDDGHREPDFTLVFLIEGISGKKAYYCALGSSMGQGGFDAEWYGCYASKAQFFKKLREDKYWRLCDDIRDLPDSEILAQWYHGPDEGNGSETG